MDDVADALRNAARRNMVANRLVPISVGGVPLNVQFLDDGTTNLRYLSEATDGLSAGDARKVIDGLEDLTPLQRAYAKITNANGDVDPNFTRYIEKDGNIIWLERGTADGNPANDYGFDHIWDKHHPLGAGKGGSGSRFPADYTQEDLKKVIFEVIEDGDILSRSPRHQGKYAMQKSIDFGGGRVETVIVAIEDGGKIITAYPLNHVE